MRYRRSYDDDFGSAQRSLIGPLQRARKELRFAHKALRRMDEGQLEYLFTEAHGIGDTLTEVRELVDSIYEDYIWAYDR